MSDLDNTTYPGLVFALEGTEYERGWGSRPDGYWLFLTQSAMNDFLAADAIEKEKSVGVPDEYTAYRVVGRVDCREEFRDRIQGFIDAGMFPWTWASKLKDIAP